MYNFTRDLRDDLVDSITLKVEPVVRTDEYNKMSQSINNGYSYVVKKEDAGKALLLITQLHMEYHLPCGRVYPIKWESVSPSNIKSLEQIAEDIKRRKGIMDAQTNIEAKGSTK